MAVIRIDPDRVGGYAALVTEAADELTDGATLLNTAPLTPEAFGTLGTTIRLADAYGRAAEVLRGQLNRGAESLTSAAESLRQIVDGYAASDDDGARSITRSGQV